MTNTRSYELDFRPTASGKKAIQFYGPFRDRVSMGIVGWQMVREFAQHFDDVAAHNYFGGSAFEDDLRAGAALDASAPVGVFIGIPDHVPESFFLHPFSVGVFVCETDAIDPDWVTICNRLDLVVVPSRWCGSAFRRSGVTTPLLVVPHGLEPEYQPYRTKQRNEPFTFYNTFYKDSLCSRKSLDELVRCFTDVFANRSDVNLRLRTEEGDDLAACRRKYDFKKLIHVEPIESLGTEAFARIYSDVHCTVHPSKGEGFGMIPFQSIACETPVIAPHATGMRDYLDADNSIALNTKGNVPGEDTGNRFGTYFGIDEDHLAVCLQHAVDNWEREYDKVVRAAPAFRERFSWNSVLKEFRETVGAFLDDESREDTPRELRQRYT